jgi:hypothetical protein
VNSSGMVPGTSWTFGSGYGVLRLSLIGFDDLSEDGFCASDINDRNTLVGLGPDSSIVLYQAVVPSPIGVKGTSRDCRRDPPRISDRGRVAGTTNAQRAFMQRNGLTELLPLPALASASRATSINACGTIAGSVRLSATGLERPAVWRRMNGGVQVCDL